MDENLYAAPERREQRSDLRSQRVLRGCLWLMVGIAVLSMLAIAVYFYFIWLPVYKFKAAQ
jgi:hypothetical protein